MAVTFSGYELTPEEVELILEDQRCALESAHMGSHTCEDLQTCSCKHFDLPLNEIISRQILMGKLTKSQEPHEDPRPVFGRRRRSGR